MYDELNIEKEI